MTGARGLPRPFWDEAIGAAGKADCVRRVWASLARVGVERPVFLFVPDPPTPFDLAGFDLPPGAQVLNWGQAGRAIWTGDDAVAKALIAPMFELGSDWLYVIAMARVSESPTLQEALFAEWIRALLVGDGAEVPPHVLLAFEWGDFAPPPVSTCDLLE